MSLCEKFGKIPSGLGGVTLEQKMEKFENGFIPTIFKPFDWGPIFFHRIDCAKNLLDNMQY